MDISIDGKSCNYCSSLFHHFINSEVLNMNLKFIVGGLIGVLLAVLGAGVGYFFGSEVVIDKICESDKDPITAFLDGAIGKGNGVVTTDKGNTLTIDRELFKQAVTFDCVE